MKSFFKFLGILASVFATLLGALAVFDKFLKKDYFICDQTKDEE